MNISFQQMKGGYKMNEDLIRQSVHEATYQLKEGTASSFYWQSGDKILPNRVTISRTQITEVRKKGRMLQHPSAGQFVGRFTKAEESPLKLYKPFHIRTQIWLYEDYPQFIGYGTAGISGMDGRITDKSDTGDLIIFFSESPEAEWKTIRIFVFMGMGRNPDTLEDAMRYASTLI